MVGKLPSTALLLLLHYLLSILLKHIVAAVSVEGGKTTLNAPAIDAKLAVAFKAAGIGSNAWLGLAKLAHVTPALVKAHDAYRRERSESIGMLITRLRCGDPITGERQQTCP